MKQYLLVPLDDHAVIHVFAYLCDLLRQWQLVVSFVARGVVILVAAEGGDTLVLVFRLASTAGATVLSLRLLENILRGMHAIDIDLFLVLLRELLHFKSWTGPCPVAAMDLCNVTCVVLFHLFDVLEVVLEVILLLWSL